MMVLLARELRLSYRRKTELLNPLIFFFVVTSLFPFGVSPEPELLQMIAPGIIWVCILLAILLSLDSLYRDDYEDGSLEQMVLAGTPLSSLVVAKSTANWLFTAIPLIITLPLIAAFLNFDTSALLAMYLVLLLGTPSICLISAIGMCLTVGLRKGGILMALLVLPLQIPVLIFGATAVNVASMGLSYTTHLLVLAGLLVFCISLAPWAAGAALKISLSE